VRAAPCCAACSCMKVQLQAAVRPARRSNNLQSIASRAISSVTIFTATPGRCRYDVADVLTEAVHVLGGDAILHLVHLRIQGEVKRWAESGNSE